MNSSARKSASARRVEVAGSSSKIGHILGMGMGMEPRDEGADAYRSPAHLLYGEALVDRHEWRHTVFLVEFLMQTRWQKNISVQKPPAPDSVKTQQELEALKVKQAHEGRRQRTNEIIAEVYDYIGLYENLCGFDAHSHPVTSGLIRTVDLIGWTVVQYYKEVHGRPRPSQLEPQIRPAIRVPSFSSYPSGHATQVHLISFALQDVLREQDGTHLDKPLDDLAKRIAENREWAGVHYESDTAAGQQLASDVWSLITRNTNFLELIRQAKLEWAPERGFQSGQKFLMHDQPAPEV